MSMPEQPVRAVVERPRPEVRAETTPQSNPLRLSIRTLGFGTNRPDVHNALMLNGITRVDQAFALTRLNTLGDVIGVDAAEAVKERVDFVRHIDVHGRDAEGLKRTEREIDSFVRLPISLRAKTEIVTQLGYVTPGELATVTAHQLESMEWPDTSGLRGAPPEGLSQSEVQHILGVAESLKTPQTV